MTKIKIDYTKYDTMTIRHLIKAQESPKIQLDKTEKEQYKNEKLLEFLESRICEVVDNVKPQKRIQKYAQYYKLNLVQLARIYDKIDEKQKILEYNKTEYQNLKKFLIEKIHFEKIAPQYGLYKDSLFCKLAQKFKQDINLMAEIKQEIDTKYQSLFAESSFKADSANNAPKNFLDSAPKIAESSQNINYKSMSKFIKIYRGADKNATKYFYRNSKIYLAIDYFITNYLAKYCAYSQEKYHSIKIENYTIHIFVENNTIKISRIEPYEIFK